MKPGDTVIIAQQMPKQVRGREAKVIAVELDTVTVQVVASDGATVRLRVRRDQIVRS